jgi:hypothetical protein
MKMLRLLLDCSAIAATLPFMLGVCVVVCLPLQASAGERMSRSDVDGVRVLSLLAEKSDIIVVGAITNIVVHQGDDPRVQRIYTFDIEIKQALLGACTGIIHAAHFAREPSGSGGSTLAATNELLHDGAVRMVALESNVWNRLAGWSVSDRWIGILPVQRGLASMVRLVVRQQGREVSVRESEGREGAVPEAVHSAPSNSTPAKLL